mmetsp:Transcript_51574/g.164922  ORF Transcript_51574/g.164922 Transcript_51574/m.164922 type:complete len:452 (-) Transcript_51574:190-1545(-)
MAVEVGAASQGGDICGPGAHHPACGPRHDPHRHHLHLQVRDDPGGGGARAQRGGLQLLILHLHVPGHRHAVHGRGPARGGGQRGRGEHHQPRHLHRVGSGRSDHRRDTRHRGQRRPRHRLLPRAGGPCLLVPRYPRAGPARRHRSDGGQRRHDGTERQPHPLPRGAAFRGDKHRAGRAVHPRLRHGHRGGGVGHPNLAARRHRVAHGGARKGVPHTRQGPAVLHPPATGHQGLRGTHGPAHGALRRQEPGVHVDPDERDNAGDGAAGGAPARVVRVGGVHIQPGPDRAGCHRLHPLVVPQGPRGGGAAHGGVRGCGGNVLGALCCVPAIIPGAFTPDRLVVPVMGEISRYAFLALVLAGADVSATGCLLARKEFKYLASRMLVTLSIMSVYFYYVRSTLGVSVGTVWGGLCLFFSSRLFFTSGHLYGKVVPEMRGEAEASGGDSSFYWKLD